MQVSCRGWGEAGFDWLFRHGKSIQMAAKKTIVIFQKGTKFVVNFIFFSQ